MEKRVLPIRSNTIFANLSIRTPDGTHSSVGVGEIDDFRLCNTELNATRFCNCTEKDMATFIHAMNSH